MPTAPKPAYIPILAPREYPVTVTAWRFAISMKIHLSCAFIFFRTRAVATPLRPVPELRRGASSPQPDRSARGPKRRHRSRTVRGIAEAADVRENAMKNAMDCQRDHQHEAARDRRAFGRGPNGDGQSRESFLTALWTMRISSSL